MSTEIIASTGCLVGRSNGYDYRRAVRVLEELQSDGIIVGCELMMLKFYYDNLNDVANAINESNLNSLTIHCEKDIGTMLSDAAVLANTGKKSDSEELRKNALEIFEINCKMAEMCDIHKMVVHLWGGLASDSYIEYNADTLPILSKIAKSCGVRLYIENIPSKFSDPLSNWLKVLPTLEDNAFTFDTRFATLHDQVCETLTNTDVVPHIEHVHVSDFTGGYRNFAALRPILHPGEGVVKMDVIAELLKKIPYDGFINLESPVMNEADIDVPKLKGTLAYLNEIF